ncbi:hypothetical protein Pint_17957 [Pistacia integerrima]|uniref:Uncharacterized protein n=1 Tax=Pistacia integerrima TaxID=434235 RepID=A0ACC0Z1P6_9ROSI|nr:hypothetical protein Pint_17957 [Pistacia integerrima]
MKSQLFNLIFQLFGIDCEMWNVNLDEFNHMVLIKDMKTCVAEENAIIQLYPNGKFRVEAKLLWLGKKCLIENDEDVAFLFKQYGSKGLKDIRLYVDAFSV